MFVRNLRMMLAPVFSNATLTIPIIKTVASQRTGISELAEVIETTTSAKNQPDLKSWLLAEKAYQMIQAERMKDVSKSGLKDQILALLAKQSFNLYSFIKTLKK